MNEAAFRDYMERIGLDPDAHDVAALHRAYLRLSDLMPLLDTDEDRSAAKPLFRFDPREPL